MRAYLLTDGGCHLAEVPDPTPAPGQVVVQVAAAGLCHSDLTLAGRAADAHPFALPIVLGHELAGTVVALAPGVTGLRPGDRVVGYGPRGCGRCGACARGAENYCPAPPRGAFAPGLGADGALAQYVAVDADHLLLATEVDPVQAAALSDAGLTAFHALRRGLAEPSGFLAASPTVVVIGVGGLGHAAIQFARLSGAVVIAVDRVEPKLDLARALGADHVVAAGPDCVAQVRDATAGRGADLVMDFVAAEATLAQSSAIVAVNGVISVVGVGAGRLAVGMHALPFGARTDLPFWGTRSELHEVLRLAATGRVLLEVEEFGLEETAAAYALLDQGRILGRAVVTGVDK